MANYNVMENQPSTQIPPSIVFTDSAARKVYQLIEGEQNFDLMLRVFVTGGGCSGFQYGFTFDETVNSDDYVVEKSVGQPSAPADDEGGRAGAIVTLLIDAMSYQYLTGAEIDYQEDLQGAQFIIRNPKAKTTCGCGSSFAV